MLLSTVISFDGNITLERLEELEEKATYQALLIENTSINVHSYRVMSDLNLGFIFVLFYYIEE